jgi:YidC/Oxa1 family membrane protein insertase
MDKNRTIFAILTCVVVVSGWLYLQKYMRENYPDAYAARNAPAAQEPAAAPDAPPAFPASAASPTTLPTTGPTTSPTAVVQAATAPAAPSVAGLRAKRAKVEQIVLGPPTDQPDDPTYAMRVTLNGNGAGVEGVTLNGFRRGEDFKKLLKDRDVYTFQHPYPGKEHSTRPLATTEVVIDDKPVSLAYDAWELRSNGAGERTVKSPDQPGGAVVVQGPQAVFVATVVDGDRPVLEVTKTFTLFPRASVTKGYELAVDHAVRNLTDRPVKVRLGVNGPALPPREAARSPDRQLMGGYAAAGTPGPITFKSHTLDTLTAEKPTFDLTTLDGQPAAWAGASSVYFDAFVLFDDPKKVSKVTATAEAFDTVKDAEDRPTFIAMQTAQVELAAAGAKDAAGAAADAGAVALTAHFGPRWRQVLNDAHYALMPRQYDLSLIITSGPCAICTFGWLINVLVWMLNGFHWLAGGFASAGDWGIAIILLVALVRTLLHPITKRSQMQMMKMGKMGPAIAKLKEKYGDDKEGFTKAQMGLMKEQGMAPILGCLPMFLQMPIWMALWQALQSTFELRQAPFLWGATWIRDLSRPDYLIKFESAMHFPFGFHVDGINLLPILMGCIFHVQARIQNSLQPKGTDEQETQKKMMMWMSTFLFPLFLYNGPSGLNLYILTSTLVGIIESKVIRDHIKQREAAEAAAGPVVVDARPTRAARKAGDRRDPEPVKPTGLAGFLQRLQEKADEISNRGPDRPGGTGKAK